MQPIHKWKTRRSFPRVNFPPSFSLSANIKHFSYTKESMKLLDEIIIQYVEKQRDMLNLDEKQQALLIINVSSGQMTKPVVEKMACEGIWPGFFSHWILQSIGLPRCSWRSVSPNGTVVALCKSLRMVKMLIAWISSRRCLFSSVSMLNG